MTQTRQLPDRPRHPAISPYVPRLSATSSMTLHLVSRQGRTLR